MSEQIEPKIIQESTPPKLSPIRSSLDNSKFNEELELSKKRLEGFFARMFVYPSFHTFSQDFSLSKIEGQTSAISEVKKSEGPNSEYNFNQPLTRTETKSNFREANHTERLTQDIIMRQSMGTLQMIFPFQNILLELANRFSGKNINLGSLVEEIVGKIKFLKDGQKTELELNLMPKELGRIGLKISLKEGIVSIIITASAITKEILEVHLAELKESLKNSNLAVGNLEVEVGQNFQGETKEPAKSITLFEETENPFTPFADSYILSRKLGWLPELKVYVER